LNCLLQHGLQVLRALDVICYTPNVLMYKFMTVLIVGAQSFRHNISSATHISKNLASSVLLSTISL
jgi:hypothetical protein